MNTTLDVGFFTVVPALDIEKSVQSVFDADDPTGPLVAEGGGVLFTYVVTNTGNVPLTDVTVTDDRVAATAIDCGTGDDNVEATLAVGASVTCTATATAATPGQYTNTGTAVGNGPGSWDASGDPTPGPTVDDTDDANYFTSVPGVEIQKFAQTTFDADDPGDRPIVRYGVPVRFTYVVTNTGNVPLSDLAVTDDVEGAVTCPSTTLTVGASMTCTVDSVAAAGQYSNLGSVTGTGPDTVDTAGDPVEGVGVTDDDPAGYFGADAEVDIEKTVQTTYDADTPIGPMVASGATVRWAYTVTNTGNVALTNVVVVDDQLLDDTVINCGAGADNVVPALGVAASVTCVAFGTAIDAGQYTNTGSVTAVGPGTVDLVGDPVVGEVVTDADDANYFAADPAVDVETVAQALYDADTVETAPLVAPGDPVVITTTVTNPGNVPLDGVTLWDPLFGHSFVGGDTDGDGLLDPGEIWTYTTSTTAPASGTLSSSMAVVGTGPETVDADGDPVAGASVGANDAHHVVVSTPGIDIEKSTNGEDADSAPGPYVESGQPVTWTYTVSNTGNVALAGVTVADDVEGAATYVSGDTDGDLRLDTDETWVFQLAGTAAGTGRYTNEGRVTGTGPDTVDPAGDPVAGATVSDTDLSHHYGAVAGVAVEKATNTVDADDPADAPLVAAGAAVRWTYTVTNTGNVDLADVVVVDDQLVDDAAEIDCGDGDNVIDLLEPGAANAVTCEATGTAIVGPYANVVLVAGDPVDDAGDELAAIADPVATDLSHYVGVAPAVAVEKATQTVDADDPVDAPLVAVGDTVTWTYVVTNTGNVDLTGVGLVDDVEGVITCPAATLAVGASMTCTATGTAGGGLYANTATVTADGPGTVDLAGDPVAGAVVTDDDDSHYLGVENLIAVEKSTNGVDADVDPVWVRTGDPVTWAYVVTNIGTVELSDVELTDDAGTLDPADDWTLTVVDLVDGDTDGDGALDPDETWRFEVTSTAVSGPYTNTARVVGVGPDTVDGAGAPVPGAIHVDDDPSSYVGVNPSVTIAKDVNGYPADTAPGVLFPVGTDLIWTYEVTNTGDVPLTGVAVDDDQGVAVTCPTDVLAPGASMTCEGAGQVTTGEYVNVGTVSAQPAHEDPAAPGSYLPIVDPSDPDRGPVPEVTASNPAHHVGYGAGLEASKSVCAGGCDPDDPADWHESVPAVPGDTVQWRIEVTNTGDVDLVDVVIDDSVEPACSTTIDHLAVGETTVVTCATEVSAPMVNTVEVEAVTECGLTECSVVTPTNPEPERVAEVTDPADLVLDKAVDDETPVVSQLVEFTITVVNEGGASATDVDLTDVLPDALEFDSFVEAGSARYDPANHRIEWTIDRIEPGETRRIVYRARVVTSGESTNVVTIEHRGDRLVLGDTSDRASIDATNSAGALAFTGTTQSSQVLASVAVLMVLVGAGLVLGARRRT